MDSSQFLKICKERCALQPGDPVIVAFSGGADSLSLLILLRNAGFKLTAAHFNHQLRAAAVHDESSASITASKLEIPFISGSVDVAAEAKRRKQSIEEAARQCRYTWLFEQARLKRSVAVAVGHTADDQIETLLMHLIRGAGLEGLRGMPYRQVLPVWDPVIPVVRPLLDIWRIETESICEEAGLQPVMDESNESKVFFRNRIRHDLIPQLVQYNPQVKQHLLQTTRILSEEEKIIQPIREAAWVQCFIQKENDRINLRLVELRGLESGVRTAILRRALWEMDPSRRDLNYSASQTISEFVENPSRSRLIKLSGNVTVQILGSELIIWLGNPGLSSDFPQMFTETNLQLILNGNVEQQGWKITCQKSDLSQAFEAIRSNFYKNVAWLDAEKIRFPMDVRTSMVGERFKPLGLQGKSQKLSDFWVNQKVPRAARKNWPLIISNQEIIWIPGYAISEVVKITNQTSNVIRISIEIQGHQQDGSI